MKFKYKLLRTNEENSLGHIMVTDTVNGLHTLRYGTEQFATVDWEYTKEGAYIAMFVPESKYIEPLVQNALHHIHMDRDVVEITIYVYPDAWTGGR